MDVCLVSTLNFDVDRRAFNIRAPLNVLSLESYLKDRAGGEHSIDVVGVDLYLSSVIPEGDKLTAERIIAELTDRVMESNPQVVGFSTCADSYHITLDVAENVKRRNRDCTIIFGGPHSFEVSDETLSSFPFVDVIVMGEGEETLLELLNALERGGDLHGVDGISFRDHGEIVCTRPRGLIERLDELPIKRLDSYYDVKSLPHLPVEGGRGCPYRCSFCSTAKYWRRMPRFFSPERIVDEVRVHAGRWNRADPVFHILSDLYFLNEKVVRSFCRGILNSGFEFSWGCTARADTLNTDIIKLMKESGCIGIGCGLETASPRMQKLYNKNIDVERGLTAIFEAIEHMQFMDVSFILGHPAEEMSDVKMTVEAIFELVWRGCASLGLNRFNHLTFFPGTDLYEQYKNDISFNRDHLPRPSLYAERHIEMIKSHPGIFPHCYLTDRQHERFSFYSNLQLFIEALLSAGRSDWDIIDSMKRSGKGAMEYALRWSSRLDEDCSRRPDGMADGAYRNGLLRDLVFGS